MSGLGRSTTPSPRSGGSGASRRGRRLCLVLGIELVGILEIGARRDLERHDAAREGRESRLHDLDLVEDGDARVVVDPLQLVLAVERTQPTGNVLGANVGRQLVHEHGGRLAVIDAASGARHLGDRAGGEGREQARRHLRLGRLGDDDVALGLLVERLRREAVEHGELVDDLALVARHRRKVVRRGGGRRDQGLEALLDALDEGRARGGDRREVRGKVRDVGAVGRAAERLGQTLIAQRQEAVVVARNGLEEEAGLGVGVGSQHVGARAALVAHDDLGAAAALARDRGLVEARRARTQTRRVAYGLAAVRALASRRIAHAAAALAIGAVGQRQVTRRRVALAFAEMLATTQRGVARSTACKVPVVTSSVSTRHTDCT